MTYRRAFWILATPFVAVAHRFKWCSYAYVNYCIGARNPHLFNPLWQHRHYGAPIARMPDEVILGGIMFDVAVSEGTVTFVTEFGPLRTRMSFYRDPHDRYADMWYVELSGQNCASHVTDAYAWIKAVFGGSHEHKNKAALT